MEGKDRAKKAWTGLMGILEKAFLGEGCTCLTLTGRFESKHFPKHNWLKIHVTSTLLSDLIGESKKVIVWLCDGNENEISKRLEIARISSTEGSARYVPGQLKDKDTDKVKFNQLSVEEYHIFKSVVFEALLDIISRHAGKATLRRSKPRKATAEKKEKKVLSIALKENSENLLESTAEGTA